jgi:hypothetical protein
MGEAPYVLRVPEEAGFDWCAANTFPVHDAELVPTLFGTKYRLAFEPGVYPVGPGVRVPFRFELRGEERPVVPDELPEEGISVQNGRIDPWGYGGPLIGEDTGSKLLFAFSGFDLVPSLGPEAWWAGDPARPWGMNVWVSGTPEQLEMVGNEFLLGPGTGFGVSVITYYTWMEACDLPDVEPDRTTVVFEDGEDLVFDTRKLRWTVAAGFATGATGSVDGFSVETSDYFRVTYTDRHPEYMGSPVLAAKLDEPGPEGECAIVVWLVDSEDLASLVPEAWFVSCDDQLMREVPVLEMSTEFAPQQISLPSDPRSRVRMDWFSASGAPDRSRHP